MLPSTAERNLITLVSELLYLSLECSRKQRLAREDTVEVKETRFVQQTQVRTPWLQEPFQVEELRKLRGSQAGTVYAQLGPESGMTWPCDEDIKDAC